MKIMKILIVGFFMAFLVLAVLPPIFVQGQQGERNSTEVKEKFAMCEQFKDERMDLEEGWDFLLSCGTFAASDYVDVEEYIIQEDPTLLDHLK